MLFKQESDKEKIKNDNGHEKKERKHALGQGNTEDSRKNDKDQEKRRRKMESAN